MEEYNKSLESNDADDVVCVSLFKWFCLTFLLIIYMDSR